MLLEAAWKRQVPGYAAEGVYVTPPGDLFPIPEVPGTLHQDPKTRH